MGQGSYTLNYLGLAMLAAAALVVPLLPILLARVIAPKKPGSTKQSPYECGVPAAGDPWSQFRVQYYLYAIAFVVFDVEVLFLYPWAVVFKSAGLAGFAAMAAFLLVLAGGLAYLWQTGALEWD